MTIDKIVAKRQDFSDVGEKRKTWSCYAEVSAFVTTTLSDLMCPCPCRLGVLQPTQLEACAPASVVEMAGFNKSQFSKRTGNHLVMTWWICVFGFVV